MSIGAERSAEGAIAALPAVRPVPSWIAPVFTLLALVTIPWTAYLAVTLPEDIRTRNYRVAWVGFDIGLTVLLLLTAVLAYRGHRHMVMTATATATALLIDAWFDVVTSPTGHDLTVAVATALFGELPLTCLCGWIALQVDRVIARRMRQLARRAERGPRRRWRVRYRR
ncbi:hypothetical protein [Planosporangium mesophilum]|uniref:Uncharacterized protein n=1 Tax=Planosporangium mesophilum TaxID=689768 RepID=A0A8J3X3K3_9ACTN|nr:hypothetical protein [Planosporangium mesophilum]NJC86487.1 hypothetical protein [Planosporangium mesophilum]GII26091.1 hypothetical protein Pme01_56880 [Planosporangium mesophilum]